MSKCVNYPNKISGLDGFQVKILNQRISEVVNVHNVGFDYDLYTFSFFVYELNVRFYIYHKSILNNSNDDKLYFFNILLKYIDKVYFNLMNDIDITSGILSTEKDLDEYFVEHYDYLNWGLIKTKVKKEGGKVNA